MRVDTILIGLWLAVDGVASFLNYMEQSWWEQLIRIIRIFMGLYLIFME